MWARCRVGGNAMSQKFNYIFLKFSKNVLSSASSSVEANVSELLSHFWSKESPVTKLVPVAPNFHQFAHFFFCCFCIKPTSTLVQSFGGFFLIAARIGCGFSLQRNLILPKRLKKCQKTRIFIILPIFRTIYKA